MLLYLLFNLDEFKRFHFVSSRTPKFAKTCVDSATSSKMDITRLTSNLQTVLHTRAAEGFVQLMEQFVADLSKVTNSAKFSFGFDY